MAKKTKRRAAPVQSTGKRLRWRITKIKDWRKYRELTQQDMSDRLADLRPPIILDRVSVQRIENGKQMPATEAIEGMAKILETDIESLLNRTPGEALPFLAFQALDPEDRAKALRLWRATKEEDGEDDE